MKARRFDLIYCAGGNRRLAQIALDSGFKYGAQLPDTVYFPLYFADQDWKEPDREVYMAKLEEHRPHMATVMDLEGEEQFDDVLSWAEEAAQWVDVVIIIPKVMGIIPRIPEVIDGVRVRLGYSVPTKYGGTEIPLWEWGRREVHVLGGSPHAQMRLMNYLNVASADGNMMMKMATRWCQYWVPGNARYASNRWWPTLREAGDGVLWGDGTDEADAPYEAFRRSCENISSAWGKLLNSGVVV